MDLVDRRGFDAVTVDDIAAAAGFSRRTFFNHFSTKAGALFDADPEDAERLARLLVAVDDEADTWSALRQVCIAFIGGREERIATRRRRLIADHPELVEYARTANRHVEESLARWVQTRCDDLYLASLTARTANAVITTAFAAWQPGEKPERLVELIGRGFDHVASGLPAPATLSRSPRGAARGRG